MESNAAENVNVSEENGHSEENMEGQFANMAVDSNDNVDDENDEERTQRKELPKLTRQSTGDFDYSELPRSLIATNVDDEVFTDESVKVWILHLCFWHWFSFSLWTLTLTVVGNIMWLSGVIVQ